MDKLIALSAATLILAAIPGPNVALIVANSVRYGFRMGVITVFGTTLGVAVQLCIVLLGLAALIEIAADALTW
ncbi:MAG: LysE family transporter [Proteobacteria bacterium]|nr:LysE family transporter [Pseudomonadota bacterium]MDA1063679.1 LysE family transporter [Pseudomonadota bacterium]